jgi:hypothetical protein
LILVNAQGTTMTLVVVPSVTLSWDPSPDTAVTGYLLRWGRASGGCTNQLDIGNATNATLGGLESNVSYYFAVVAYDGEGGTSPPSKEIEFIPSNGPPAITAPELNFELQNKVGRDGTTEAVLRLSFQGNPGTTYHLETTEDFQHWETLWITNCPPDGIVAYQVTALAEHPAQFFRLLRK